METQTTTICFNEAIDCLVNIRHLTSSDIRRLLEAYAVGNKYDIAIKTADLIPSRWAGNENID